MCLYSTVTIIEAHMLCGHLEHMILYSNRHSKLYFVAIYLSHVLVFMPQEIPLSEAAKYQDAEWDISRINRMYAQKEDRQMIKEFRENFLMNLGKVRGWNVVRSVANTVQHQSSWNPV